MNNHKYDVLASTINYVTIIDTRLLLIPFLNQIATKPICNFNFMLQISVWITDILLISSTQWHLFRNEHPAPVPFKLLNYVSFGNLFEIRTKKFPFMVSDICVKLSDMDQCFSKAWLTAFGSLWIDLLNVLFCVLSLLLLQHNKTKRRRLNSFHRYKTQLWSRVETWLLSWEGTPLWTYLTRLLPQELGRLFTLFTLHSLPIFRLLF